MCPIGDGDKYQILDTRKDRQKISQQHSGGRCSGRIVTRIRMG